MTELLLFGAGIIVGIMNAVAGGGMLIGFPVLLATGMPALIANATTSIIVLPGNISSAYAYRKYLRKVPGRYLFLLIPAIIGAAIGANIMRHTSSNSFKELVPGLILIAVVLFAFQPFLHNQLQQHLHGPKVLRNRIKPLVIVGAAVLPLSIYGGYFGAGFGFIMLAFLGFTHLYEHIHRMNALKNIITICLSSTSIVVLYSSHLIDWRHGLVMATGNLIGGYSGARFSQRFSTHAIRIVVIAIGMSAAAYLALRSY